MQTKLELQLNKLQQMRDDLVRLGHRHLVTGVDELVASARADLESIRAEAVRLHGMVRNQDTQFRASCRDLNEFRVEPGTTQKR